MPFMRYEDDVPSLTLSSRPTRTVPPCPHLPRGTENHSNPALRLLKTQQNEQIPVAKYTIPPKSRTSHPDPSHERPETHRYNNKKKKNVVNDRI